MDLRSIIGITFEETNDRLWGQLSGSLVGTFVPWIDGIESMQIAPGFDGIQSGQIAQMPLGSKKTADVVVQAWDPIGYKMELKIQLSKKLKRRYFLEVKQQSVYLNLDATFGFLGSSVDAEKAHFNGTLSRLENLHPSADVTSRGFG